VVEFRSFRWNSAFAENYFSSNPAYFPLSSKLGKFNQFLKDWGKPNPCIMLATERLFIKIAL
jgi:hypothetical protein